MLRYNLNDNNKFDIHLCITADDTRPLCLDIPCTLWLSLTYSPLIVGDGADDPQDEGPALP